MNTVSTINQQMEATPRTIRNTRWAQQQAEAAASAEIIARLDALAAKGKCVSHTDLDKDVFIQGKADAKAEKYFASIFSEGGEVAFMFTSYERIGAETVEAIIEGRTTYARTAHSRRVLVTATGDVFTEVDGRISLYAKKYEDAAREMLGRLYQLGLWRAARRSSATEYAKAV